MTAKRGFTKGYNQIIKGIEKEIIPRLYEAIGCKNRSSFSNYKKGKIEPKVSQAEKIEKVFNEFGITNIWDK